MSEAEPHGTPPGRRRSRGHNHHDPDAPEAAEQPLAPVVAPAPRQRTLIMGVLNVTPDSFSDGGRWENPDDAIAHAEAMVDAGASIIDVGGESTRPGATPVATPDERKRVLPIVRELVDRGITVSIDTLHASTARAAVEAGAEIINDVSGGLADKAMARVVAETGVHFVAMHWRGGADVKAGYQDVVAEVRAELKSRVAQLVVAGVEPSRIVLDPGLGFAKDSQHNWELLGRLDELASLGHGILIGASRKRFIGALLPEGAPMEDRDFPTAVISALAARSGAWAVRVHDVPSTRLALDVWERWQDSPAT
jgi:dihydropteroate synthase